MLSGKAMEKFHALLSLSLQKGGLRREPVRVLLGKEGERLKGVVAGGRFLLEVSVPYWGEGEWKAVLPLAPLADLLGLLEGPVRLEREERGVSLASQGFRALLKAEGPESFPAASFPPERGTLLPAHLLALALRKAEGKKVLLGSAGGGLLVAGGDGHVLKGYRVRGGEGLGGTWLERQEALLLASLLPHLPPVVRLASTEKGLYLTSTSPHGEVRLLLEGAEAPADRLEAVLETVSAPRGHKVVAKTKALKEALGRFKGGVLSLRAEDGLLLRWEGADGSSEIRLKALVLRPWRGEVRAEADLLARALKAFKGEEAVLAVDEEERTLALFSAREREGEGEIVLVALAKGKEEA